MALRRSDRVDHRSSPELFDYLSYHRNGGVDKHFEITHADEFDPMADGTPMGVLGKEDSTRMNFKTVDDIGRQFFDEMVA